MADKEIGQCPIPHALRTPAAEQCPVKPKVDSEPRECPVDHRSNASDGPNNTKIQGTEACPVKQTSKEETTQTVPPSACPMHAHFNPNNNMSAPNQQPAPDQRFPLPRERVVSSIPNGSVADEEAKWVYPSEQMFFNAMKKKGWSPSEKDMPLVVAIHNTTNEKAWNEILRWEQFALTGSKGAPTDAASSTPPVPPPKLVRFQGRPNDLSPKAWFLSMIGYSRPFDRHDWLVERTNKEQVRYVIDFYEGGTVPSTSRRQPIAMHLDVRPAVDSLSLAVVRLHKFFLDLWS
uniref:Holocytochrome c-type synthase n=1 Tax=Roombia sp. NY0200 TaxID=1263497 RepID=A0A1E1GHU4_9CRYP|nr:cytochrome c heme-lyase [Roombia sp. NY0200]